MGITVIGEDNVENYLFSLFGKVSVEFGLLIGQNFGQKIYVASAIRTPDPDEFSGEENEDPKKVQHKSLDKFDTAWVTEHARQVNTSLPGGIRVVGVYAFASPDVIQSGINGRLKQLLTAAWKVNRLEIQHISNTENKSLCPGNGVILYVSSNSKRISCKNFDVNNPHASGQPAEWKCQNFISKCHYLQCKFLADASVMVRPSTSGSLSSDIMMGLINISKQLFITHAMINSELRESNQLLVPGKNANISQTFTVDLYNTYKNVNDSTTKPRQVDYKYAVNIIGEMDCYAYVHSKATVAEAIHAIKVDIMRSLHARFRLLCEDIEQNEPQLDKGCHRWSTPRRVTYEHPKFKLKVCDYMFKDEDTKSSIERISDLYGSEMHNCKMESAENFPDEHLIKMQAKQNIVQEDSKNDTNKPAQKSAVIDERSSQLPFVVAVVIGIVAVIVFFLVWK